MTADTCCKKTGNVIPENTKKQEAADSRELLRAEKLYMCRHLAKYLIVPGAVVLPRT